ncbi:unnamed protein product [Rhodiola kirilowii]
MASLTFLPFASVASSHFSELLGIAASVFRSSQNTTIESLAPATTGGNEVPLVLDRETVVKSIKDDFSRSYFVTDDKGLQRFKRNCSNFGSLIEKSNMELTKWEDFEDKGVGHWKFSCVMSFPWKPILSGSKPSSSGANGSEKYIEVISVDNHEFWYMGFLNYDGAVKCFQDALENNNLQRTFFATNLAMNEKTKSRHNVYTGSEHVVPTPVEKRSSSLLIKSMVV